uniref:N-acetylglucosaminylphosphatidylinositol deacetylase n=1 Tax=Blastobotrys adeninivorans TaxID=409370 RepID=A0A060TGB5_BLAAD
MLRMSLPILMFGLPPILWMFLSSTCNSVLPDILKDSVTLVVSHPDDELMFFGPTYATLASVSRNSSEPLKLLSLSNGNADGEGAVREQEIVKAAVMINMTEPTENVKVINHPQLQDEISTEWDAEVVAQVLEENVSSRTIITFDDQGASEHPNHVSAFKGAVRWKSVDPENRSVFVLKSVPIYRKYLFFGDSVYRYLETQYKLMQGQVPDDIVIGTSQLQYQFLRRAMSYGHKSQMKWYRWFYLQFSRYMVLNELQEI